LFLAAKDRWEIANVAQSVDAKPTKGKTPSIRRIAS